MNVKWVLIGLLLLAPGAWAAGQNPIIDLGPVVNAVFGVQQSVGGVNNSVADLNQQVTGLPNVLTGFLTQMVKQSVGSFAMSLVQSFKSFLTHQPNVERFAESWKTIVTILSTGYILIFAYFGLKLLQQGNNPIERGKAKGNIGKIAVMILLTSASLAIYELLLSLNGALVSAIWTTALDSFFSYENLSSANFFMLIYFASMVLIAFTTLFLRYLIVMAGILLFPLAIFLYFFEPLQFYGRLLIQLTGLSIFLPFFDVLLLWGTSLAMQDMGSTSGFELLFPGVGFLLMGISNIWLIIFASIHSATNHPSGK